MLKQTIEKFFEKFDYDSIQATPAVNSSQHQPLTAIFTTTVPAPSHSNSERTEGSQSSP